MAVLEMLTPSGGFEVEEFVTPVVATWIAFIVDDDLVGVSYDPSDGVGYAKTYGVGWFAIAKFRMVGGLPVAAGVTPPEFVTHQGMMIEYDPPITISAIITQTRIGVSYDIIVGDDS